MPDVNVLVYAHRSDSERHEQCAAWVTRVATAMQPFALSELVLSGFVRVVTNRRIFVDPSTTEEAFTFLNALLVRPTCRLARPGPRHFDIFKRLCLPHSLTGGIVADAYHAALAIELGCTWVTHDTDFARFAELSWRLPE